MVDDHAADPAGLGGDRRPAVAARATGAGSGQRMDDAGCIDHAQPVVPGVGDVDIASRIGGDSGRQVQARCRGRPFIAGSLVAAAGDLRHRAIGGGLQDPRRARIGDEEVAIAIAPHPFERLIDAARRLAGEERHHPGGRIDLADHPAGGEVDVPGGVDGESEGIYLGRRRLLAGTVEDLGRRAAAGNRRDLAVGRHLADPQVAAVRDEKVARRIERDVLGILQGGAGCRAAIAGEAGLPGAGYRRDGAAGVDLADDVVTRIGDEDVAGRIEGHVSRPVQLRRGGRTPVA